MDAAHDDFCGCVGPMGPAAPTGPSRFSRRRLIVGGLATAGLTALTLGRSSPFHAQTARVSNVRQPAGALQPATRIGEVRPDLPGEVRFPILVDEGQCCFVMDNFGAPRGSRRHEGVDIAADYELPVIATVDGTLVKRYEVVDPTRTSGAGNGWSLLAADGTVVYKFFHLDRHADDLDEDDEVEAGQTIGYIGNTGTSGVPRGDNFHLHFEYRPVDPESEDDVARDSFGLLERPAAVRFAGEGNWCTPEGFPEEEEPPGPTTTLPE